MTQMLTERYRDRLLGVLSYYDRIVITARPGPGKEFMLRVRIKARGTELERASLFALSDPWHGAPRYGDDDLKDKFRRQARTLAPLSERWHRQVETIIEQTLNLEQMNVREFVRGIQL